MIVAGLLLYAWREPERIVTSQEAQMAIDLNEAMTLYAQNCSICHGLAGEGIGSTPALDTPALRETDFDALDKIVARGLFGTAMPAWSQADGGPLNDYQIGELVTLIQYGDWPATQDRVVNLGLAPLVPFTTEPDPEVLDGLAQAEDGEILAQGITLYAQECVACHGADGLGTNLAPALNDLTIRQKSVDELARTILNGVPGTLMAPWDASLSDKDVTALVKLLAEWDQLPSGAIPAPDRPVPVTEQSLALGSELYASSCARCHAGVGQGTPRAPALNVRSFLERTNDAAIQQIITLGVPGTAMPAWGDRLSEADIQAIVGFIRSWEPTAPEVAEPARGGGSPWWRSGAGSPPGGKGGGPPWMRNFNTGAREAPALPSGGGPQSGSGASAGQGSTQHGGASVQGDAARGGHKSGGGGPPSWAGQGTGQAAAHGQVQEDVTLDWRAAALIGGGALLAFMLVGVALLNLRRLAV
jgi:mono/diheme cytochrome c family protein